MLDLLAVNAGLLPKQDPIEAKRALGQDQGFIANTLADTASVFRYRGFLPEEIAESRLAITGETDAIIKEAKGVLSRLDTEVNKVLKEALQQCYSSWRINFLHHTAHSYKVKISKQKQPETMRITSPMITARRRNYIWPQSQ